MIGSLRYDNMNIQQYMLVAATTREYQRILICETEGEAPSL
jgi:hypothetical protein